MLTLSDRNKILKFMEFSELGNYGLKDKSVFKVTQYFPKSNPQKLFDNLCKFGLKCKKLPDLRLSDHGTLITPSYST
jgi:hypothetical protein